MKRAIIVHGFKGKPETNWKPWLKVELEAQGFIVEIPTMPNTDAPQAEEWLNQLRNTVGAFGSDEIYLVGHSLGCITILKYLETLQADEIIKAAVFVAGFTKPFKEYTGAHDSFFSEEIDFLKVKEHSRNFVAIHSKDDPNVGYEELSQFEDKLDAQVVLLNGSGHFGSNDGVFEVPVVRDVILNIT
ncbi:MAG: alpha/beta fold hydrolase [Candidatus Microsaccharimonas sp.]